MDKKYLIVLIFVVCIGVLLGYVFIKGPLAEGIRDNAIDSLKKVNTYEFSINISSEGDTTLITGGVDYQNKKAKSKMAMTSEGMDIPVEIYVVEDVTYLKMLGTWTKKSLSTTFDDEDYLKSQMELVKYSQVVIGNETNETFYVLDVKADNKKFLDYIKKQATLDVNESENIGAVMKVWVEKVSNLPKKIYIGIKTKDVNLNTTLEISEYNKNLDIKLPGEAETARWVSESENTTMV